jgi:hypothetical protein
MQEPLLLESTWYVALVASVVALVMLLRLARTLPPQNLLLIASGLLAGEAVLEFFMLQYSMVTVEGAMWCYLAGAALLWLAVILFCQRLARLIVQPWLRAGYFWHWVIALTAILAGVFQFGWASFSPQPVPVTRAAVMAGIRAGTTAVLMLGLVPWFMRKRRLPGSPASEFAQEPENKAQ